MSFIFKISFSQVSTSLLSPFHIFKCHCKTGLSKECHFTMNFDNCMVIVIVNSYKENVCIVSTIHSLYIVDVLANSVNILL